MFICIVYCSLLVASQFNKANVIREMLGGCYQENVRRMLSGKRRGGRAWKSSDWKWVECKRRQSGQIRQSGQKGGKPHILWNDRHRHCCHNSQYRFVLPQVSIPQILFDVCVLLESEVDGYFAFYNKPPFSFDSNAAQVGISPSSDPGIQACQAAGILCQQMHILFSPQQFQG